MKIIAFAASNSKRSINKKLVSYAVNLLNEHDVEILDLNDYEMPLYSEDREQANGIPKPAINFANKIDSADLILISFAEHNGAYAVAFKNLLDWTSRIPGRAAFGNKPVFLMSTSPGERGGANVMQLAKGSLPYLGASILDTFSLPKFDQNFDEKRGIRDNRIDAELKHKVSILKTQLLSHE